MAEMNDNLFVKSLLESLRKTTVMMTLTIKSIEGIVSSNNLTDTEKVQLIKSLTKMSREELMKQASSELERIKEYERINKD